jgi:penicillin-binding protein 2
VRKIFPILLVSFTGIVFIVRLVFLQFVNHEEYSEIAINQSSQAKYEYPQRGYIYDRNGTLLAGNQPSYDVMLIPRDLKPFDTAEFARLLNIKKVDLVKKIDEAKWYSWYAPSIIVPQLTKNEYAYLQENMYKYEGFYIQKRSLRAYNLDIGANFLGYIAEVSNRDIKKNPYYQSGDLIGRQGVEEQYEELLRGERGVKYLKKNKFNNNIGYVEGGKYNKESKKGSDLSLTIDADLQAYGRKLMKDKRGGIVALEPSSGEILALITEPTFEPSLLIGRKRSRNFTKLWYETITTPLPNTALQAQ